MFGENWCDVNSDDELGLAGIPELPPLLPLLDFASAPVSPEKSGILEDGSTTSAGGSAPENADDNGSPKAEPRIAPVNPDTPKVCFIGNFPPTATIEDFREFIDLKGINVTEIRMGPRKKQNSNGFGYVDLASQEDYEKLLADDGCMYQGRKIRIDMATPHKKNNKTFTGRKNHGKSPALFGAKKSLRGARKMHGRDLRLNRVHSAPQRFQQGATQQGRAGRFFMSRKTGARNYQKRSPKNRTRKAVRSSDPFTGARANWRARDNEARTPKGGFRS